MVSLQLAVRPPRQGEHEDRKDWIVERLRELVELFDVDCGGFAVMETRRSSESYW